VPRNDGVLNSIGMLGVKGDKVAFDIVADGNGANDGWLIAGDTLYNVDLASGRSSEVAKITGTTGKVRDIAAMPKI
jgi:hypothetical protein